MILCCVLCLRSVLTWYQDFQTVLQGVGKNKLVDRLLNLLNKPREYIQLNRDTTVQTLTLQPSLRDGVIVYEDSPLVQVGQGVHSAQQGHHSTDAHPSAQPQGRGHSVRGQSTSTDAGLMCPRPKILGCCAP